MNDLQPGDRVHLYEADLPLGPCGSAVIISELDPVTNQYLVQRHNNELCLWPAEHIKRPG